MNPRPSGPGRRGRHRRWTALTALIGLVLLSGPAAGTAVAAPNPARTAAPTAAPTAASPAPAKAAPDAKPAPAASATLPGDPNLIGAFVPAGPTRLLDTRDGTGTGGVVRPLAQSRLVLDVSQVAGNPSVKPTAVVLNVTVTNPTRSSHLTVYPAGGNQPITSNLNFLPGQTVPNLVTVPTGTDGRIVFSNNDGTTDVIADLAGYYTLDKAASTFVANGPTRLLD
ncbi:hypothetical protein ACFRMQ_29240, partial [Kitasatospora sp. NPDC056783]